MPLKSSARLRASLLVAAFAGLPVAASEAMAQQAQTQSATVSRFIERGRRSVIWRAFAINPDCTTIRGFTVRIERLPQQGEIELEKVERTIDRSFLTPFVRPDQAERIRRCMGASVPIIAVFYTPRAGYSGFDDLLVRNISSNRQRETAIEIKVAVQ